MDLKKPLPGFIGYEKKYLIGTEIYTIDSYTGNFDQFRTGEAVLKVGPYQAYQQESYDIHYKGHILETGWYRENGYAMELKYKTSHKAEFNYDHVKSVYANILKTIKFTQPKGVGLLPQEIPNYNSQELLDTSTWTTYRNEKFGFEIKYPSDFDTYEDTRDGISGQKPFPGAPFETYVNHFPLIDFHDNYDGSDYIRVSFKQPQHDKETLTEFIESQNQFYSKPDPYYLNKPKWIIIDTKQITLSGYPAVFRSYIDVQYWQRKMVTDYYKDGRHITIETSPGGNSKATHVSFNVLEEVFDYMDYRLFNTMLSTIKLWPVNTK